MKRVLLFMAICLSFVISGLAQPCKQISIDDFQQKILTDYIDDAVRKGAFVGDKGIVVVTRFINQNGRPSWSIRTALDDAYKDNPPVEWVKLERDIVLFYDTQSSRFDVVKHEATPELLHCLDEAIEDRVYIRPAKRERTMMVEGVGGKVRKVNARRIYGGNVSNGLIVIFESDGRITKLSPV